MLFDQLFVDVLGQILEVPQDALEVQALEIIVLQRGSESWHLDDCLQRLQFHFKRIHICLDFLYDLLFHSQLQVGQSFISLQLLRRLLLLHLEFII